jgi:hypothetical protein
MDSRLDDFQWWITLIPDRIEELKQSLPKNISDQLDRSIDSLDILEKYLLSNYTAEKIHEHENASVYDGLARYIGSTLNRNIENAEWYIELEDQDDVYYNVPVLVFKDFEEPPLSPFAAISMIFYENTGEYLSFVAKRFMKG